MTDPKECRANAARCFDMANSANGNVWMQHTLYDMAKTWLRLADQVEAAEARNALNGSACPAPASFPRSS
jgi:hypothetical protein